jgi:hypothetical protein
VTATAAALARLRELADGLVYSSEADHPFETVQVADDGPPTELTAERLRGLLALDESIPLRFVTVERVLGRHTVFVDSADLEAQRLRPRYEALGAFLGQGLRDVRAIRAGRSPVVTVWLLGRTDEGDLVGYRTVAVET